MMDELQAIIEFIRSLGPFFAAPVSLILLAYILKKYVFAGWGDIIKSSLTEYFDRERNLVRVQTETNGSLQELIHQVEALARKVSDDIHEMGERMRSVELVFSDHIDRLRDIKDTLDDKPCIIDKEQKA